MEERSLRELGEVMENCSVIICEDHVMTPSLKGNSTLGFPDISVISPI